MVDTLNKALERKRKFIIVILGFAIGIVMAFAGKLTPEMTDLIIKLCGMFILGNVVKGGVEKISNRLGKK